MFKERHLNYLEEGIKDFFKSHPVATTLGAATLGTGAGLLYNHLTDGADNLKAERQAAYTNFIRKEAPANYIQKDVVPYDKFKDYVDNYQDAQNDSFWGDHMPFTRSNDEAIRNMNEIEKTDPRFKGGGWIDNMRILPDVSPEKQYMTYKANWTDPRKPESIPFKEIQKYIDSNPTLAHKQDELMNDIKNSVKDSYIRAGVTGTAIGAGGHLLGKFVSKKIKDKYGDSRQ